MSRIYFHSEHDTAEVRGSERAMGSSYCSQLLAMALGLDSMRTLDDALPYLGLFPANHYIHRLPRGEFLRESIITAISVGEEFFTPALNTANDMGSDPIKLLARLHGQCEIHAYVEGPNRAWLAGIIARGREIGIFRAEMGWESVVDLLRSRDDGPVVTSYSVCESFPNSGVAKFVYDGDAPDAWYDLPHEEQWRMGLAGIRSERGLEMKPDNWSTFYFGDGRTGFDLYDEHVRPPAPSPNSVVDPLTPSED